MRATNSSLTDTLLSLGSPESSPAEEVTVTPPNNPNGAVSFGAGVFLSHGFFGHDNQIIVPAPEAPPAGLQDLTSYTAVDEDSDFTITSTKLEFDSVRRDAVSYVYYDFGVDYFGDFDIDFEFEISFLENDSSAALLSISNTLGTQQDMLNQAESLQFWIYGSGAAGAGDLEMKMKDYVFPSTNADEYLPGGTSHALVYCTFKRIGMDLTCDIYSDSDRTILLSALSFNCSAEKKRYLHIFQSRGTAGSGDPDEVITGYIQNVIINSVDTTIPDTQDLTTYTQVDADGSLAVTEDRVTFTTLPRNLTSYVVYDFGVDYFDQWEVEFELKVDDSDDQGNVLVCGFSDTLGSFGDMQAANDCLAIWMYGNKGALRIYNSDFLLDRQDYYLDGGTSSDILYITWFNVDGTSSRVQKMIVYSDAARTTKIDTVDINPGDGNGNLRYFYALASRDVGTFPTEHATGYGQNYKIIYPV
jgi:hypothetical protein